MWTTNEEWGGSCAKEQRVIAAHHPGIRGRRISVVNVAGHSLKRIVQATGIGPVGTDGQHREATIL